MQEKFLVACGARDRRMRHVDADETALFRVAGGPGNDRFVNGRIGDEPMPAHFLAASLELRLDEGHDVGAGRDEYRNRGEDMPQRDEGHIDRDKIDRLRHHVPRERARVDAFANHDTRVVAQAPIELAVADVERDHAFGASLQQYVGKPTGRRPDVERAPACRIDVKHVESVRELDAAPSDVRMIGRGQLKLGIWSHRRPCLRDDLSIDVDAPGKDQRPSSLPRDGKSTLNEGKVKANFRRRHAVLSDIQPSRSAASGSTRLARRAGR